MDPGAPVMPCSDVITASLVTLLGQDAADVICAEGQPECTDATACAISYLAAQTATAQGTADDGVLGLNVSFLLNSGYIVFIMQLGFAMLCAGLIRSKNQQNILTKNLLDACVGGITWYLIGFGFAYGKRGQGSDNAFIGNWNFAIKETVDVSYSDQGAFASNGFQAWFFQYAFAAAAATITSGAVAERCTFMAYGAYTFFMTGFTYPVVVHSVWSADGWLSPWSTSWDGAPHILKTGAIDFAGSGVVHMVGGMAAGVGAYFMGPRIGRFSNGRIADPMPGHSAHLVVLGTVLLWFGWYGFNPGSNLVISGFANSAIVSRVAVTTTLGACAGGITLLFMRYFLTGVVDLVFLCNGILAGLVAITAGCSVVEPWAALIVGAVAAPVFYGFDVMLHRLHIDDAVSAFPLHAGCGAWGVLFVGLLAKPAYVEQVYSAGGLKPEGGRYGVFYGGHGQLLLCQLIEVLFIIAWVGLTMGLVFGSMKFFGLLRISEEEERIGLDRSKHSKPTLAKNSDAGSTDMVITAMGDNEFSNKGTKE